VEVIKAIKETNMKLLHKGLKKWNDIRNPHHDNTSKENEPPAKRMTRALEVRFSCPACPNYWPASSVLMTPTPILISRIQLRERQTCQKDPDWRTLKDGLRECLFCHCGKYSLFFTAL